MKKLITGILAVALSLMGIISFKPAPVLIPTPTLKPSRTPTVVITSTPTVTQTPESTIEATSTLAPTVESTFTPIPATATVVVGNIAPYPSAPLCPDSGSLHDKSMFHTLWDETRGCHYDHEHGQNPFTPEVAAAFPDFDLFALLGGVEVGHTNPSSGMENTHKHGGFKWQALVPAPQGCALGFEDGEVAINAAVIQYHNFGDYSIEFESRVHSAAALLRQCKPDNPTDYGYVYTVQHIDYGQRVSGYQGDVVPYPDTPLPAYPDGLAPYFTVNCINRPAPPCGNLTTRQAILDTNQNTNTVWTSKSAFRVGGSSLFMLLFRARDTYQIFDWSDTVHPFTFLWMCSNDGGGTYAAQVSCRYNNSTSTVHEVQGTIPAEWDNLEGFDTDPRIGRITAEGFTTRFGTLNSACTVAGPDCHPIKLVRAFVGFYSTDLCAVKCSNPTPANTPERDLYFLNGQVVSETTPGAISSGWIGSEN
jgi:signal peptidase I